MKTANHNGFKRRKKMEAKEVNYKIWTEKGASPIGTGEPEQQVNIFSLVNEYEQIEAQIQELNSRKQQIRKIIYGELTEQEIEETSVITASGTKFVLKILKVKRETVDKKLLRAELGEKAEKFITVTESEYLSIRPAKKNQNELKEAGNGKDDDIRF